MQQHASRKSWIRLTIAGGVFMMGNDGGKGDEKPRHHVRLEGFRISPSPITNRQYLKFLEDTGYRSSEGPGIREELSAGLSRFARRQCQLRRCTRILQVGEHEIRCSCPASDRGGMGIRRAPLEEREGLGMGLGLLLEGLLLDFTR